MTSSPETPAGPTLSSAPAPASGSEGPGRLLALHGAVNFRDLGGYETAAGRQTRWRRLFRSDILHELTSEDVDELRTIGLRTVIDLRLHSERELSGLGPLEGVVVANHHYSVLPPSVVPGAPGGGAREPGEVRAAPSGDDLAERYLWYLEVGQDALAGALTVMSDPGTHPLVFHCTAGKDRTGVLAALLLDLLGVPAETIVADYVLTAGQMPRILERLRADPHHGPRLAEVPSSRFAVEAGSMERFMTALHQEIGGAARWARAAGVPASDLDRLAEALLEPAG